MKTNEHESTKQSRYRLKQAGRYLGSLWGEQFLKKTNVLSQERKEREDMIDGQLKSILDISDSVAGLKVEKSGAGQQEEESVEKP